MATTHYDFPTVNGSDAINGVDAINGLANAVDTALYATDGALAAQTEEVNTAKASAASAMAAAGAASTNATAAQQTAQAASNTAVAANSTAASAAAAVNELAAKFNLSEISTISTGLSISNLSYSLTLAQNSDGTVFKFYGYIDKNAGASATANRVAIPGGSGPTSYGLATGLYLSKRPTSAIRILPAASRISYTSSAFSKAGMTGFVIGTDGQIYIFEGSSTAAYTWASNDITTYTFFPCIYFNSDFGDFADIQE